MRRFQARRELGCALIIDRLPFYAASRARRHLPPCSAYADEAIGRFGLWAGGWMTLARLCRCHPFGTSGLDFVPAAVPDRARWYLPWRFGRWRGTNCAVEGTPSSRP